MLEVEGQFQNVVESRDGWYLDAGGDPWFFNGDGDAICAIDIEGRALNLPNPKVYGPFTRLTGKIIISNEGL